MQFAFQILFLRNAFSCLGLVGAADSDRAVRSGWGPGCLAVDVVGWEGAVVEGGRGERGRVQQVALGGARAVGRLVVSSPGVQGRGLFDCCEIILADEISPDSCRLWDMSSNEKLDKDRFRRNIGGLIEAYKEVATRLEIDLSDI